MPLTFDFLHGNDLRLFGLTNSERVRRMAEKLPDNLREAAGTIVVNLDYAFDPIWLSHIAAQPGRSLHDGDVPILVHTADADPIHGHELANGQETIDLRDHPKLYNETLRKLQQPFCLPLTSSNRGRIERESYSGAYKGVTDLLTKYLWPTLAFHLTRLAARLRMTPNMVTAIGAFFCVLAPVLFAHGDYAWGVAAAFVFMVLDTVDGKLARCTMTSSWWGNIFDHGLDLVHPPFWYWFWATGLASWGLAYDATTFWVVQGVLIVGYVLQRLIEGAFIKSHGFHIHVWRKFDSDFRLITARRNPNMILLAGSLIFARPDIGLILVAVWTMLSLLVHMVQLIQARSASRHGKLRGWLEEMADE